MVEKKNRQKMNERSNSERIKDFQEVPLGYTVDQAISEARRCIQCKNPQCVKGCPVEIDIPGFLRFIVQGNFEAAVKKIKETNALPAVCGRVCPQEEQCELKCILGKKNEPVGIGRLERFVADVERQSGSIEKNVVKLPEKKIAKVVIAGSGPAGLTCAGDL